MREKSRLVTSIMTRIMIALYVVFIIMIIMCLVGFVPVMAVIITYSFTVIGGVLSVTTVSKCWRKAFQDC